MLLGIVGGIIAFLSAGSLAAGALLLGLFFGGGLLAALLALIALALSSAGVVSGIVTVARPQLGGILMLAVGGAVLVIFTLLSLAMQGLGVRVEGLLDSAYWLGGALLIVGGIVGLRARS